MAHRLVKETLRRKNFLDRVIRSALAPRSMDELNLGLQSFLRLFTYQMMFVKVGRAKSTKLAKIGRSILGWKYVKPVEEALGKIFGFDVEAILSGVSDEERVSLMTFHPL